MKNFNETEKLETSSLIIGSEPLSEVRHRAAFKTDDDDAGKDTGDDDTGDSDDEDSDATDKADKGDTVGADGRD